MRPLFDAYRQAYSGLPREVWMLSALMFVSRCGSTVLPFLTIFLVKVKGFEPEVAVQFLAVYGVGGILGSLLGARLCERFGPLRTLLASLVLRAPGYLIMPHFDSGAAIGLALLYVSLIAEMSRPAIAIATTDYSPGDALAKSFALNRLAANLGFSIAPAVGGLLAAAGYWDAMFWVNTVTPLLAAAAELWSFGLHEPPHIAQDRREFRGLAGPWSDRHYLWFLALQLLSGVVFFQMMSTYPLYLSEQVHMSEDQIGFLFVINTSLIVLLEMLVTDRLRGRSAINLVSLGVCLLCLGFGGTVLGGGAGAMAALAVVWTAGEMLSAPFAITYAAERAAGRNRAAYLGLNSVVFSVSAVGAPLIGGLLYAIDPQLVWWCCLAMAVALPLGYWVLARQDAKQAEAAAAGPQ